MLGEADMIEWVSSWRKLVNRGYVGAPMLKTNTNEKSPLMHLHYHEYSGPNYMISGNQFHTHCMLGQLCHDIWMGVALWCCPELSLKCLLCLEHGGAGE